jgi:CDGSH iron-sulfur domain-containing protein 3
MDKPVLTQKAPYHVDVEAGKKYYYCTCGLSEKQPFCDMAHKGTDFKPTLYETDESKTVYFCGCRASKNGPLCDRAHKDL